MGATVKVGGGLNYVVGPMGAGKSLYGVREIVRRVLASQYVVTNVELYPDAPERIASRLARFRSAKVRQRVADKVRGYYVFETDLAEAMRYRLPGKGDGRGSFVWDETHNDLNNRDWRKDGREQVLEWSTQLRKLGFVGYLLSQHHENTDAALRRVCSFLVRLQNQREQTRLLGMRVTPWPLFLACWYPTNIPLNDSKVKPMRVERYFLGWHRHLYDTHGLYHGLSRAEAADRAIWLPEDGRARGIAQSETAVQSSPRGAAAAHEGVLPPLGEDTQPQAELTPEPASSVVGRNLRAL
jgi:hypothetical protein